jgi:hypothetical protein
MRSSRFSVRRRWPPATGPAGVQRRGNRLGLIAHGSWLRHSPIGSPRSTTPTQDRPTPIARLPNSLQSCSCRKSARAGSSDVAVGLCGGTYGRCRRSATEVRTMTDLPKLMTVPQAALALRIGRSTAYELANAWLDSDGAEGLPVVRIGRSLRVPVAALDRWFGNVAIGKAGSPAEAPLPTSPEPTASGQMALFAEGPSAARPAQPSRSRPRSSAAARSRSCRKAE